MVEQPPQPQTPPQAPPRSNAPVVIRIILGILFLLPGACGSIFLGMVGAEYATTSRPFSGPDSAYAILFIVPAAASILISVILIGILLRYARWEAAPKASLVAAIVALITVLIAYQLASATVDAGAAEDKIVLLVMALGALAVSAVPPFLHWWKSRATS